jgi:hypothetical protein
MPMEKNIMVMVETLVTSPTMAILLWMAYCSLTILQRQASMSTRKLSSLCSHFTFPDLMSQLLTDTITSHLIT